MKKGFIGILLIPFLFAAMFFGTGISDAETTWNMEIVDQSDNTNRGSAIAVDADGRPHIIYNKLISYSYNNSTYTVRYAYWSGGTWVVEDLLTGKFTTSKLIMDSSGNPHIVLVDRFNKEFVYGFRTNSIWTFETIYSYSMNPITINFDFTLDINDQPHIVLQLENYNIDIASEGYTKYATKNRYATKSATNWSLNTLDAISKPPNTAAVLKGVSIVLDSNSNPHVSYSVNNSIKYANKQGNTWVEETATGGREPQIVLDSNNVPHILASGLKYITKTSTGWSSFYLPSSDDRNYAEVKSWNIDATGKLYCYYFADYDSQNYRYKKINYNYNTGAGWTNETLLEWDENPGMYSYQDLVIDNNGNMLISGESQNKLHYMAAQPEIEAIPGSVDFGDTSPGNYVKQDVIITNTGNGNLNINSITVQNPIETDFVFGEGLITNEIEVFTLTADNASGRILAPGETGTVTARFTPEALNTYNGSLIMNSNDRDNGRLIISLSGAGVEPPEIDVAPTALDFGNVALGSSLEKQVTISNQGAGPLDLGELGATGESFSLVGDVSNTTVEPQSSTSLTVRFAPVTEKAYSGSITIPSNDSDENPVTINLGGSGVIIAGEIYVTSGVQDFGDVYVNSSADAQFTVENIGNGELIISSITVSGAQFSLVNDDVSNSTLSPGGSASFTVRFSPSNAGTFNGSVAIASDDPDEPDTVVSLTGRGTALAVTQPSVGSQGPTLNFITTVQISATDPDGAPVSFSLGSDAPDFVTLSGTRLIFSSDAPAGTYTFTVNAHGNGGTTSRKLTVTSFGRNGSPVIQPVPTQGVQTGSAVKVDISVIDPDGDQLILGLSGDAPRFASIKGSQLVLEPQDSDVGTHTFLLLASDGRGGLGVQKVKAVVSSGVNN